MCDARDVCCTNSFLLVVPSSRSWNESNIVSSDERASDTTVLILLIVQYLSVLCWAVSHSTPVDASRDFIYFLRTSSVGGAV